MGDLTDRIREVLALAEAATPGPWEQGTENDPEDGTEVPSWEIRGPNYEQVCDEQKYIVSDVVCVLGFSAHTRHKQNIRAIIALRNLAPPLLRLLLAMLEEHAAARCIRHWHDTGPNDEGMIVSAEHVRKLWDASDAVDAALEAVERALGVRQ